MKFITIEAPGANKIKYPSIDSGIDDYIHELIIRSVRPMYENNDDDVIDVKQKIDFTTKKDTIDNILNVDITSGNRRYYFDSIKKNLKVFEPTLFFKKDTSLSNVFKFLRVNNYIHGIFKFIKERVPEYYDTIKNNETDYYDKSSIENERLLTLINRLYGGDNWKCFKKEFINTLEHIIFTSLKTVAINTGFYTLNSLLDYHFEDLLKIDCNKYMLLSKEDNEKSVTIVRPVGSESLESHDLESIIRVPNRSSNFLKLSK